MPTPAADAPALPTPRLSHLVDVTTALAAHAERHDRTADLSHSGLAIVHEAGLLTLRSAEQPTVPSSPPRGSL